jgi:hypothetical protein
MLQRIANQMISNELSKRGYERKGLDGSWYRMYSVLTLLPTAQLRNE